MENKMASQYYKQQQGRLPLKKRKFRDDELSELETENSTKRLLQYSNVYKQPAQVKDTETSNGFSKDDSDSDDDDEIGAMIYASSKTARARRAAAEAASAVNDSNQSSSYEPHCEVRKRKILSASSSKEMENAPKKKRLLNLFEQRVDDLRAYKEKHGHVNVKSSDERMEEAKQEVTRLLRQGGTRSEDDLRHLTKKHIIEETKSSKETKLGLTLGGKEEEDIQIISINAGSIFDESELQIGMIIHKINNKAFSSYAKGVSLLKEAEGNLTIEASFPENPQPKTTFNSGEWSLDELHLLVKGLELYGAKASVSVLAGFIRSKTKSQVYNKISKIKRHIKNNVI